MLGRFRHKKPGGLSRLVVIHGFCLFAAGGYHFAKGNYAQKVIVGAYFLAAYMAAGAGAGRKE